MTTNHIRDTTADKNRQNWCTPNWYVMAAIWVIRRVVFRIASRDISPRCIRKSIDRLELIREYVLWQIGFFIETNPISKKTQILSPLPDREWHTSQCQGPSGRRLTSNQPVKISVPGSPIHVSTLLSVYLYTFVCLCLGVCIFACRDISVSTVQIWLPFWSESIGRNLNGQKRLWWWPDGASNPQFRKEAFYLSPSFSNPPSQNWLVRLFGLQLK